ncbi:MAG: lamin tail domain-containing protein, partial [Bacteroidota bacterium]
MKLNYILFSLFVCLISSVVHAQDCDRLFFSEYVVGNGNNRAIELYNPTSEPIDLDGYVIERWSNGEQLATDELNLQGVIPAYGTWVVVNGQTEDINLGVFISPACDPALQALADQLDNPYPAPMYMNGNDALVLLN